MTLASRIRRLEAAAGRGEEPLLIVFAEADGRWRDAAGERVNPADLPANARVIVISVRDDGPQ